MKKDKKRLLMIGNSHIDPVWFWQKEEGMQEVKATFLSALERIQEFDDFKFTASSSYFYQYLEKNCPELFREIQERVAQGRFEVVGGWVVEADGCMPNGESLVRQGLYAQRFFESRFGSICKIGFAPDTFGHAKTIPMLLRGVGIEQYCHQRPDSNAEPLFIWRSEDGSSVKNFHLPSEYTVWFEDQLVKSIQKSIDACSQSDTLACFYGVGNHGGGPTIENIKTIKKHTEYSDEEGRSAHLELSTLSEFFKAVGDIDWPVHTGGQEPKGGGCYAVDAVLKRAMRQAEHSVLRAEKLCSMAKLMGCKTEDTAAKKFAEIWEDILFNQFHDIICGTSIKPARDHAQMELGGCTTRARTLENAAIQAMANSNHTFGEGFPLFLFNPHLQAYSGMFEVEIPWFCKAHMMLVDDAGNEVPYQRVKTECTMVNYNLSGRRRIVFQAYAPSFGYSVYRLVEKEPCFDTLTGETWITGNLPVCKNEHVTMGITGTLAEVGYTVKNDCISVTFDQETGLPNQIVQMAMGYNCLKAPIKAVIYTDTGDTWGGGGVYEPTGEVFVARSMRMLENGPLRKVVKTVCGARDAEIEFVFTLYTGDEKLYCKTRVWYHRPRTSLLLEIPVNVDNAMALVQIPHGCDVRPAYGVGNYMHGFIDVNDGEAGVTILNNGCYHYILDGSTLRMSLARSPIYAQGGFEGWYSENADFTYVDNGYVECELAFTAHGEQVEASEISRDAQLFNQPITYLFDTWHKGEQSLMSRSALGCDMPGVELAAAKPAEEGEAIVLRLLETGAKQKEITILLPQQEKMLNCTLPATGLTTLRLEEQEAEVCDMLERVQVRAPYRKNCITT
jgi:alpha-mannosidase